MTKFPTMWNLLGLHKTTKNVFASVTKLAFSICTRNLFRFGKNNSSDFMPKKVVLSFTPKKKTFSDAYI